MIRAVTFATGDDFELDVRVWVFKVRVVRAKGVQYGAPPPGATVHHGTTFGFRLERTGEEMQGTARRWGCENAGA